MSSAARKLAREREKQARAATGCPRCRSQRVKTAGNVRGCGDCGKEWTVAPDATDSEAGGTGRLGD